MIDETQSQSPEEPPTQEQDRISEIVRAPHFQAALELIKALPATGDLLGWLEDHYATADDGSEGQATTSPLSPQSRQSRMQEILAGIDTMGDGDRHVPVGALIGHLASHFRGDETLVREHALAHLRRADVGTIFDGGANSEFEKWLRPICRSERGKRADEHAQRDRQDSPQGARQGSHAVAPSRPSSKLQIVEHVGDPRVRESTLLFDFDFRKLEGMPRPPLEWLWENRMPLERSFGFSGDGGIGKSTVLFQMAVRCAAGGGN